MIFDRRGRLIVAEGANTGGGRRVSITERDGTIRTLADNYDNKRFNSPNDVAVDRDGRVYVSDPRYVGNEPRELDFEGVFLIDLQGDVIPLLDDGHQAQRTGPLARREDALHLRQRARRRALIAADRGAERQGLERPRHPRLRHRPRDRRHDRHDRRPHRRRRRFEGKPAVLVLSPDGKILATIPVPEDPANVEFGGDDRKTLYICAGKSLYRIKTTMTGHHLWPPRERS